MAKKSQLNANEITLAREIIRSITKITIAVIGILASMYLAR